MHSVVSQDQTTGCEKIKSPCNLLYNSMDYMRKKKKRKKDVAQEEMFAPKPAQGKIKE